MTDYSGKVWKFGDNVNTDMIMPGRFNITTIPEELAKNVFSEVLPEFAKTVMAGDIIVGGNNFGCGSSREHAPIAIKGAGVRCVIAKSFARIFYRNAINIGLPVLICENMQDNIFDGDIIKINMETGIISDAKGRTYAATKLPGVVLKIISSGGIVNFLKFHDLEELKQEN